jgi:7,8-dihydropterin-6-yl-methyl-4-(beta-D-ribofuranosyl)aminobenzene 5'-phosphate synthase
MASLSPPASGGEEVQGMDREETVISADSVTITVIFDNIPFEDDYATSGGFACLVEIPGTVIVFDAGGHGSILMRNTARQGIDPGAVDIVVISHEHWDHTGGLGELLESNPGARVYIPSTFGSGTRDVISKHGIEPIDVSVPVEIVPGVFSSGVMGEAIPEQSILLMTDRGPMVITGCAHPGVAEIAAKGAELAGAAPLLVMGGWHLGGADGARIETIIETFSETGVRYVAPSHCTGENAMAVFEGAYGDRFIRSGAGKMIRGARLE